jgi:hypothetical protein
MKRFLLVVCLALSAPVIAKADSVLVFGDYPSKDILATSLTSLGHSVTNVSTLPADLGGFDTIWHVGAFVPLTADEQTRLANYLAGGGGIHLTGERPCCEPLNDSLQSFVNSVVTGGAVQVGDLGDINGAYTINPSAHGGLATTPNSVSVWVPSASGGMGGLGSLPSANILATGAGDVPVGGAWISSELNSSAGRMTLLMDVNWFEQPGSGDNLAIIDNIQTFLSSSEAVAGTARFNVTKTFTNGDTGDVEVTLTCNGGIPLQQNFTISGGDPAGVTFVVTNLPDTGANCSVTESGGNEGYTSDLSACSWTGVTSGVRSCPITNVPEATTVSVDTTVDTDGDATIDPTFTTTIVCENVSPDTGPVFGTVTVVDTSGLFEADWYADPDGGTDCTVTMVPNASAVEGDSCSIPTLSQYGLALMALLMLGIGFVGFRRFV